ncbi:hypothetical protein CBR_g30042 [Chara braunii]|uniref:Uncharacterized protein n=1 Tax=Chara braunii TaxID=69332 RepID=A0A388LBT5_CHABU|nr:hypothetical protein CBR_g30042 [Chara braunii]|eukprot:GBG79780.1 hypothetical protein CBR_g30042 [Chara braunii]
MDELLQCPDHGPTPTQILNNFARVMPDPLRTTLYPCTKEDDMTYERLSKIAVDQVGFLMEANCWKDLQKGGRRKNKTIAGGIEGNDSLLVRFEGGGVEALSNKNIDYGLEEPNINQVAQQGDREQEEADEEVEEEDVAPKGVVAKVAITREVGVMVPRKVDAAPPQVEDVGGTTHGQHVQGSLMANLGRDGHREIIVAKEA